MQRKREDRAEDALRRRAQALRRRNEIEAVSDAKSKPNRESQRQTGRLRDDDSVQRKRTERMSIARYLL